MNADHTRQSHTAWYMSESDFAHWGVEDVAYVRQHMINNELVWGICSADGKDLGVASDRAVAFAAVLQHGLLPLSVH